MNPHYDSMLDSAPISRHALRHLPSWAHAYATGERIGRVQAEMAYARYYGVDGSADDAGDETEERLTMLRTPLVSYASRTGTRRNLAAMRAAGWRLLISAAGCLRAEGFRYAIDNGAWSAFQQGRSLDERAFMKAVDTHGERADWIVLPDIVAGGRRSLDYSLAWLERLRGLPTPLLIAVQDGMEVDDVRGHLNPSVGIFVGGTTDWKERTAAVWGALARRRNCYLHIGRVNSVRRIRIAAAAGADSIDGTSVSRYALSLPRLDRAVRQADLFPCSATWTSAADLELCAS